MDAQTVGIVVLLFLAVAAYAAVWSSRRSLRRLERAVQDLKEQQDRLSNGAAGES